MEIIPIGFVQNEVKERGFRDWREVQSRIVIKPEYAEALEGLQDFSHIILLLYLHLEGPFTSPKTHPQHRQDLPLLGIFATRSPHRPNPIGMTVARLMEHRENMLVVRGLDAVDGTPVLDIKPYIPYSDSIPAATFPEWVRVLNEEREDR